MLFTTPNQQCQSTEGRIILLRDENVQVATVMVARGRTACAAALRIKACLQHMTWTEVNWVDLTCNKLTQLRVHWSRVSASRLLRIDWLPRNWCGYCTVSSEHTYSNAAVYNGVSELDFWKLLIAWLIDWHCQALAESGSDVMLGGEASDYERARRQLRSLGDDLLSRSRLGDLYVNMSGSVINARRTTAASQLSLLTRAGQWSQSCPWDHFVWPDPTQHISWLTQPNPLQVENLDPIRPNPIQLLSFNLLRAEFADQIFSTFSMVDAAHKKLKISAQPNPTHVSTQPMDNSEWSQLEERPRRRLCSARLAQPQSATASSAVSQ